MQATPHLGDAPLALGWSARNRHSAGDGDQRARRRGVVPALYETATLLGRKIPGLATDLAAIERAGEDLVALQHAHRRFLLKIHRLVP
jgi:hypothetical protein